MELQQEPHVFQRQRRIRGITRIRWIRATTGDNTDQKKQISLVDFLLRIYHFTFSLTDVIFTRKFCLLGISSFGSICFHMWRHPSTVRAPTAWSSFATRECFLLKNTDKQSRGECFLLENAPSHHHCLLRLFHVVFRQKALFIFVSPMQKK